MYAVERMGIVDCTAIIMGTLYCTGKELEEIEVGEVGIIELAQGAIPGSIAAGAIAGAYVPSILPFAIITGAIFGMSVSLEINTYFNKTQENEEVKE